MGQNTREMRNNLRNDLTRITGKVHQLQLWTQNNGVIDQHHGPNIHPNITRDNRARETELRNRYPEYNSLVRLWTQNPENRNDLQIIVNWLVSRNSD